MISQALFISATEDPNLNKVNPGILANAPDFMKDRVYDFLERFVQRIHSNAFIHEALKVNPKTSYDEDIIGPCDIAYVAAIVKNSGEIWDQDIRMKKLGAKAMGSDEKKMQPFFTKEDGQK